ncbi:MAG: RNA polymerase sigma factor [Gemmatimonadaceae bacterium]
MFTEAMLAAFHAADEALFKDLVRAHNNRLLRFCRFFARSQDEEMEFTQRTWVLAWERRRDYKGAGSFAGWLFRLARSVCLREVAENRRFESVDLHPELRVTTPYHPQQALTKQEREDVLVSLVLSLPPRQRAVVLMRYLARWSTAETAEILHCAPGTVRAACFQARESLKKRAPKGGFYTRESECNPVVVERTATLCDAASDATRLHLSQAVETRAPKDGGGTQNSHIG